MTELSVLQSDALHATDADQRLGVNVKHAQLKGSAIVCMLFFVILLIRLLGVIFIMAVARTAALEITVKLKPTRRISRLFGMLLIVAILGHVEPGVIGAKVFIAKLVIRQARHVRESIGRGVVEGHLIKVVIQVSVSVIVVLGML